MAMLFTGMIVGGIIGLTIGSLAAFAKSADKEISRLNKEIKEVKLNAESKIKG
jgi:uncharacterized membrane-anchored protein YhcB (DUF1043 family)